MRFILQGIYLSALALTPSLSASSHSLTLLLFCWRRHPMPMQPSEVWTEKRLNYLNICNGRGVKRRGEGARKIMVDKIVCFWSSTLYTRSIAEAIRIALRSNVSTKRHFLLNRARPRRCSVRRVFANYYYFLFNINCNANAATERKDGNAGSMKSMLLHRESCPLCFCQMTILQIHI